MPLKRRKILIAALVSVGVLLVIVLSSVSVSSCARSRRIDKLTAEGRDYYEAGAYEKCVAAAEQALQIESRPELYVLMAEAYLGMDDIDSAIEWLYVGSSRHVNADIETMLEKLKKLKLTEGDELSIELGGQKILVHTKTLSLSSRRLSDISALVDLPSLESLTLSDNAIEDLTPLSGLVNLTYLSLSGNKVTDLTPLRTLVSLRTLYIDDNPVEDFSPLFGLRGLRTLSIRGIPLTPEQLDALQEALPDCRINHDEPEEEVKELTLGGVTFLSDVEELTLTGKGIADISVLEECTELRSLDLRDNAITDLRPLLALTGLERLSLSGNRVEDLAPLAALPNLKYLGLDSNRIRRVNVLTDLTSLEELGLSYNNFTDLSPLGGLFQLRRLDLRGLGLEDGALSDLTSLHTLSELALDDNHALTMDALDALKEALPGCHVTHSEAFYVVELAGREFRSDATEISLPNAGVSDLSGLSNFKELRTLVLPDNGITDTTGLTGLTKLETLDLGNAAAGGNSVTDLTPISTLTGLRTLNLTRNGVSDISSLSTLTKLEELRLGHNPLKNISTLGSLPNLRVLSLDHASVSDIWALGSLTKLEELDLRGNSITDFTPLFGLSNLRVLHVGGNGADERAVEALRTRLPDCVIHAD